MPRRPTGSVPALVHHKASNRARVRINGRDFWLGKWGSPAAKMAYGRAHAGPPESLGVCLTMARPGDPPLPEFLQVQLHRSCADFLNRNNHQRQRRNGS